MSAEYCSEWSYLDALREVVQNALDLDIDEATYSIENGVVSVMTFHSTIPIECFTLGMSKKKDGAIGKYGEGLKLAMMILARLGACPVVRTGNYTITGMFLPNAITGVDTFNLEFEEHEEYKDSTEFFCIMLPEFREHDIKKYITPFGEFLGKPDHFDIFEGEGDVYVNGLYVYTDEQLKHSYNFAPGVLELNRDRNMVNGITHTLASAYADHGEAKQVFNLVLEEAKDVSLLEYYLYGDLKNELRELFIEKYGDSPIAEAGRAHTSAGAVTLSRAAYSVFKGAGVKVAETKPNPNVPSNVLTQFAVDNKRFMRRDFRIRFEALIAESRKWRMNDVY